jgi:Neuraminidase (sialidase)
MKKEEKKVMRVLELPPTRGNPRNSEGDFIKLKNGNLLFVYTHFTGGMGDHTEAHLTGRTSDDKGATWSFTDRTILPNEGDLNIMSVSLTRLENGAIGMLYLRKQSMSDCRPYLRTSADEGKTWSEPIEIIPDEDAGYYIANNSRMITLSTGRLLVPLSLHTGADHPVFTKYGQAICYYSDDQGTHWSHSTPLLTESPESEARVIIQEPGVVELKDGRLMMYCRTDAGSQYVAYSGNQGESWSPLRPSNIISPRSSASIARIPSTGDLLLVWNNHADIAPELEGKRTPLNTAISQDEGETWTHVRTLEENPHGWYCYTAIAFVNEHVLLAYSAGDRREGNGLSTLQITRLDVAWLYG